MGKIKAAFKLFLCFSLIMTLSISHSSAKEKEIVSKRIALTFDDGPHKAYTEEILNILDKYGIKATFFVVGVCAQKYPDIVAREIKEGHEIGNHTYSHAHLKNIKPSALMSEIEKTEQLIGECVNYKTTLFRPPEGVCNETVRTVARDMNYSLVLWTIDTRDWLPASKEDIVSAVLDKAKDGAIILMHDYVVGKSNTPAALEIIVPTLIEQGFTFVTVSELLK